MSRTATQQKEVIQRFIKKWSGVHKEDEDARSFLIDLLQNIFEVQNATDRISFEKKVRVDGNVKRIDAFIPETNTLIEMKSSSVNLEHTNSKDYESAYKQAKVYYDNLPRYEKGRFILTSNFNTIEIYDMDHPGEEPDRILLEDLEQEWHKLKILIDPSLSSREAKRIKREEDVSLDAGERVGKLYNLFLAQLGSTSKTEEEKEARKAQEKELNILIVRIVFCLFAEDFGLFKNDQFHDFLLSYNASTINQGLEKLFEILNTSEEERDAIYLPKIFLNFPYVNGGLFKDKIRIPLFTSEILKTIIELMSEDFDWSKISPTIFGAVFESTLNPETRRSGGMHYTSIKNIHKVIDPLFLDDLKEELEKIKNSKQSNVRANKAKEFQEKLASLKFLDPACGSGNFLTESFLCLRKLENEAIKIQLKDSPQVAMDIGYIKVTIKQFFGIEINDFAVSVARTALYIAEAQMYEETQKIVTWNDNFLPLKPSPHIKKANALRIDWNDKDLVSAQELNYIIGNPPFVGSAWQTDRQKQDLDLVFGNLKNHKKLDYVAAWFEKTRRYIYQSKVKVAFVSTNSITQGLSVPVLWSHLNEKGISINFAWNTFVWNNEAKNQAKVHCVIIGFSESSEEEKKIFQPDGSYKVVKNINAYLADAPNVFIESRREQISGYPSMHRGSDPVDGGYLLMSQEEYEEYSQKESRGLKYVHPYMMGKEFINNIPRYCFWLVDADISEIRKLPLLYSRIQKVQIFRSTRGGKNPLLFDRQTQPKKKFIAIPKVSSQRRNYIPIGYLDPNIIVGDKLFVIEEENLSIFSILNSKIHNFWMRAVAGRLKSDYSYSNTLVYNTFPIPKLEEKIKVKIEQTAQAILDARALYPDASLADLYDPLTMPIELRKAHEANDKAVMAAYGFKSSMSESQVVAELMKMYQKLVENEK